MSGSPPLVHLHAYMARTRTNLLIYIYILLSLVTQTIPLFVCFLKVKPTLHLPAFIIEEIEYYYADFMHMYKAARCQQQCEI